MKRIGITRKKLTYHYTQLDEEKAKAFNEEIKLLLPHSPFIVMDECSFYPNLDPRFGYYWKGEEQYLNDQVIKVNITLYFLLSVIKKRTELSTETLLREVLIRKSFVIFWKR